MSCDAVCDVMCCSVWCHVLQHVMSGDAVYNVVWCSVLCHMMQCVARVSCMMQCVMPYIAACDVIWCSVWCHILQCVMSCDAVCCDVMCCSCPPECLPADRAGYVHVAVEAGQGETTAGAHHDCHWHQTLQQGVWQGRGRHWRLWVSQCYPLHPLPLLHHSFIISLYIGWIAHHWWREITY